MKKILPSIKNLYKTGAIHITVGSFLSKFVALFGSVFVVRILSKSEYGLLQYVENIYSYAVIFAGLGLPYSILRYVVKAESEKKRTFMHYAVSQSFAIDCLFAFLILVINLFAPYPENFQEAKTWIPILALLLPFQNLLTNGQYSLRALFKNKEYASVACASSILLIVGRILGAKVSGIGGVFWSRFLINTLFAIVLIFIVYRLYPKQEITRLPQQEKKEVNRYSLQYMFSNGIWMLFMINDSFLLGLLTNDPIAVADYKAAYVLPGNLSLISTAIGIFIAPYFTKNEKDVQWVRKKYKFISFINALAVGMFALVFFIFAKPIIQFVYGNEYLNTIPLMRVLLVAAFINSGFRYMNANVLGAMGKVKSNLIISIVGLALQIVFNIILVPQFGALGIAYSNCVVFAAMAIALSYIIYKNYFKSNKLKSNGE